MKTINYTGNLFDGFSRLNSFPLDKSSVFLDIESLENYLTETEDNPTTIAYAGQLVSVLSENAVYLIKDVKRLGEENKNIKDCYIKFSTIQEIHNISREIIDARLQELFHNGDLDLENYVRTAEMEEYVGRFSSALELRLDGLL